MGAAEDIEMVIIFNGLITTVLVILRIHTIFCTIQLIILLMQVNQGCRIVKQI